MPLEPGDTFYFAPRALKNLQQVDELDSLAPLMHAQITRAPATEGVAETDPLAEAPVIYAATGRSARGQLRVMRLGLEVSEMAVSELPGSPNAVWTVKKTCHGMLICFTEFSIRIFFSYWLIFFDKGK